MPSRASITRANCSIFRCSTIPPTRRRQVARACVERYQALGLPIHYLHRTDRTGYKAGALAKGLKSATGEFVAIFDADFLPSPDFLRRTVALLHRSQNRDGADALDVPEPRLFRAHRSRIDSARRPFCHGAWRALAQRRFFQF